ncbi:MAG: DUF4268 domain-containing protein [Candidatus Hydrogenedentes bacterium]|nr:DUF4268 domain-containing protein [Candidatus Hydrogenedentota bacterium]
MRESTPKLGRLEKVDLRSAWTNEGQHFTPWLARPENLTLLAETLDLELEIQATEKPVGPFRADILCKEAINDTLVLIENQLERTDHTHLGQLLTYAAGLEAATVIWVSPQFTDEHRAALDWLNSITTNRFSFFGLEIELWRIDASIPAPKFNIVSKPNDWSKAVKRGAQEGLTETQQLQYDFWVGFHAYLQEYSSLRCGKPYPQNWTLVSLGREGFKLAAVISTWDSETKKYGGELRAELLIEHPQSKEYFNALKAREAEIQRGVVDPLTWYQKEGVRQCRIYARTAIDPQDRRTWPKYYEWLRERLEQFHTVFAPIVKELSLPAAESLEI